MSIKVVIIEDHETLLSSFIEIINASKELAVVAGYTNCEDALINFNEDDPDIMLIDIQLPGINGIEGIKQFKAIKSSIPTVVITVHDDSKFIFDASLFKSSASVCVIEPMSSISEVSIL